MIEPLATMKMGYPRLSRRINKMGLKLKIYNLAYEELSNFISIYILPDKSDI